MKDQRFIGTGVAIITPFKNNEIDYPAFGNIIDYVIQGGVNYIVVLGSTGEAATVSAEEERKVLDFCIDHVKNRVPIVAGNFGSNNTQALVEKLKTYNFEGISAVLSSSPSYVKPTQEGIFQHYKALADVSPVPIILYNVPGRTHSNMSWKTTVRLAEYSRTFVGIKEASADLIQAINIIKNKPEHFIVTSGDDYIALPMTAVGGDGVISVIANALPKAFSQMINFALDQDLFAANQLNMKIYDLHDWLYVEGNPVGIKAAMEILGYCTKDVRLPLAAMSSNNYNLLSQELASLKKEMTL